MLIVRDSQVKKLFYKEQEIDKILDWKGNVVFEKESAPVMTNTIKFHTTSDVTSSTRFTVEYTDNTSDEMHYSEPNKFYTVKIPTDKTVKRIINFGTSNIDEVTVSCKIKLDGSFFYYYPKTFRFISCDSTSSTSFNSLYKNVKVIETIEMKNSDFSNVTDMSDMFYKCSKATTIVFANCNTSNVTNMNSMFSYCQSLTSLDLSVFDTSNVTNMSFMFSNSDNLQFLDVSGFDTSNVTNMSFMFGVCSKLTSLDLSGWDTSKVTNMSYMFYTCRKLTSLDLSGWDTSKVTNMNWMFNSCSKLKTIRMVGCNQTTIDKIKEALTDVGILNNVTIITSDAPTMTNTIKFHTTSDVTSSKNFTVTYTDSTQDTLSYSEPSKEYTLSIPTDKIVKTIDFNPNYVDDVSVSCKIELNNYIIGSSPITLRFLNCDATANTSLSNIFKEKLNSRTNLFEMRNIDARNATSMDSFLYRNTNVRTIIMRDINISNVTTIKNIFRECNFATTIDVANWNTRSVTDFSSAFERCASVISLDLSSWDVSKAIFMNYMFYNSNKLVSLDISGWDMTNVRQTSLIFSSCKSLKTVYMRGCNQTTIDKIKSELVSSGILNNVTIVTE